MLILYDKKERQFLSNGIGRLDKYAFDDKVREELNGIYKLEFTYPLHAKHSKDIKHENIVRATVPDGEQPFFISRIVKKNGYLRVTAYHIFYLLIWQLIEDINIVNLSGQAALNRVLENTEFTGLSDISETKSIRIVRYNAVEAILDKGQDNTLISRFGGELKRDKLNVQLMNRIGRRYENYPSEIRYAKNLLSYEADIDGKNANRIMPIGFDGLLLPENYVVKPGTDPADYKTLKVEYTSVKAISNPESPKEGELPLEEAYEALRQAVLSDFENGRFDLKANYQIQFQELSMTEEYKNKAVLEKMYIGDEVKVIHTDEDLEVLSRIIAYEWSPIRKEYDEVEMGNHLETFSDIKPTLELIAGKIEQYKTDWENNVEEITEILTTVLGGHVLKRTGEILIMDTDDPETATKIWRWNLNGLGYSSTGINGPYETAITMDGRIIAKFIYALNLSSISADLGTVTAGRIQSEDGSNFWDLDTGDIRLSGDISARRIQALSNPNYYGEVGLTGGYIGLGLYDASYSPEAFCEILKSDTGFIIRDKNNIARFYANATDIALKDIDDVARFYAKAESAGIKDGNNRDRIVANESGTFLYDHLGYLRATLSGSSLTFKDQNNIIRFTAFVGSTQIRDDNNITRLFLTPTITDLRDAAGNQVIGHTPNYMSLRKNNIVVLSEDDNLTALRFKGQSAIRVFANELYIDKPLKAKQSIEAGTINLNSLSNVSVTFEQEKQSVPSVSLTPSHSITGAVITAKLVSVTKNGFTAIIQGFNEYSNVLFHWIAVAD